MKGEVFLFGAFMRVLIVPMAAMAEIGDLPQIKEVYTNIIEKMNENNIQIWDDIYPCEFFYEYGFEINTGR